LHHCRNLDRPPRHPGFGRWSDVERRLQTAVWRNGPALVRADDTEDPMRQTPITLPALAVAFALLGTGAAMAADTVIGSLKIAHPWAPATPEGAKAAPGYFTVTNTGSEPDRLVGGSFADANQVEIVAGSGNGTKALAGGLRINPGETVTLSATGPHLMFTGLIGSLERGESAQSILHFENAGNGVVEFAIEGGTGKASGRHKR
jgi:periplasmic copper chaperone A